MHRTYKLDEIDFLRDLFKLFHTPQNLRSFCDLISALTALPHAVLLPLGS